PGMKYQLIRVSEYTQDPVLTELIRIVGTGKVEPHTVQAAVWTRTDNLSWNDLASKSTQGIQGRVNFFNAQQIAQAKMVLLTAESRVREKAAREKSGETTEEGPAVPERQFTRRVQ
ncbi:MAG: hypothetical protein ACK50J_17810, partial [Planctomyces sp.]